MSTAHTVSACLFVVVVIRDGDRVLLIQEATRRHYEKWYLPAGRVEPGERLDEAAVREVREEAGVEVALDGVLGVEQSHDAVGVVRVRTVFAGHVTGGAPKQRKDKQSLQARWFTLAEAATLTLRAPDVLYWATAHARPAGEFRYWDTPCKDAAPTGLPTTLE